MKNYDKLSNAKIILMMSLIFLPLCGLFIVMGYSDWGDACFLAWGYVGASLCMCGIAYFIMISIENSKNEQKVLRAIVKSKIDQIDNLSPNQFEVWVAKFMQLQGFAAKVTPHSGDFGVDVLASKEGFLIGIQVKKFTKPVGIKAVQEISSGMGYYCCQQGWVITSASFTTAAIKLAESLSIKLITRYDLANMLTDLNTDINFKNTNNIEESAEYEIRKSVGVKYYENHQLCKHCGFQVFADEKRCSNCGKQNN